MDLRLGGPPSFCCGMAGKGDSKGDLGAVTAILPAVMLLVMLLLLLLPPFGGGRGGGKSVRRLFASGAPGSGFLWVGQLRLLLRYTRETCSSI